MFLDAATSQKLAICCQKWHICELSLFGSLARGDARPESDADVLVTFQAGQTPSLFAFCRLSDELSEVLGRRVDLLTRAGVEASRESPRKLEILNTAKVLYAA